MIIIAENREARFEYFIEDSVEAGISLDGGEVKYSNLASLFSALIFIFLF